MIGEKPATRVVVVGGGIAGLVVGYECARPGFDVVVLEQAAQVGGSVAPIECGGLVLDAGAESFATRGGHVQTLIDELRLSDDVVEPNPSGAWVRYGRNAVPLPKSGLLGIPSSPLAADVIAALGWRGALRAYCDRLLPVLTVGAEKKLGALVRKRMGQAVLDRLVAPVVTGVYSADPDDLDIEVVAPGLNAALTRAGSLSGAVSQLRSSATPGSAVRGIRGGMWRLAARLASVLEDRGALIRTGATVTAIEPWTPEDDGGEQQPESSPTSSSDDSRSPLWNVRTSDGSLYEADVVVVAVPAEAALPLLARADTHLEQLKELSWPKSSDVEIVTIVSSDSRLSTAPRGTGILVADKGDSGVAAKALTHSSAKWPWLSEYAGHDQHVVRLSYGRAGQRPTTQSLSEAQLNSCVLQDAGALLNVPLAENTLIDVARSRWSYPASHATVGQRARIDRVRECVKECAGLEVTGSWLAGTGLASVIPDARRVAQSVRGLRWKTLIEATEG